MMVPLVAVRNPEVREDSEQPMSQGQRFKETDGNRVEQRVCVWRGAVS